MQRGLQQRLEPATCLGLGFILALTGCASTGGAGGRTDRDQTLRDYRQAAAALQGKQFATAKPPLDQALATLGGITAGDRTARRARGLFHGEDTKRFRGEPYERVMAYYYRGILYWMDGELDNARACFRSAQIQDADAERGEYRSDYVLLDYLDAILTAKLNGDPSDGYKRAAANAKLGTTPPPVDPGCNLIIFAETGHGPLKHAGGAHGEQLQYIAGGAAATAARLTVNGQTHPIPAYDDLTFQATTRGGRVMDRILANKAGFKEGTDAFGTGAILSGAVLSTQQGRGSSADEVGAGLLVAGVLSKLLSAATTPRADTRCWDNLPNFLAFTALKLPEGTHPVRVEFVERSGRVVASQDLSIQLAPGRDTVVFLNQRN